MLIIYNKLLLIDLNKKNNKKLSNCSQRRVAFHVGICSLIFICSKQSLRALSPIIFKSKESYYNSDQNATNHD